MRNTMVAFVLMAVVFGTFAQAQDSCGGDWKQPGGSCAFTCRAGDTLLVAGHSFRDEMDPEASVTVSAVCGGVAATCFAVGSDEASCQYSTSPVGFDDDNGECTVEGVSFGSFLCRSDPPSERKASSGLPPDRIGADNPVQGGWEILAPIPIEGGVSQAATVASDDGLIYVIGGGVAPSQGNQVWSYDPSADEWTRRADIPVQPVFRPFSAAVQVGGLIYVFGGSDGEGDLNTLWIYDIGEDSWTRGADLPIPSMGLGVGTVRGRIFLVPVGWAPPIYEYDPAADTYTARSRMPLLGITLRSRAVGIDSRGELHVLPSNSQGGVQMVYQVETDTWGGAPMPELGWLIDHAVVTDGERIYVCGGTPLSRAQIYDPETRTWSAGPTMPETVVGVSGALAAGTIYVEAQRNFALTVAR